MKTYDYLFMVGGRAIRHIVSLARRYQRGLHVGFFLIAFGTGYVTLVSAQESIPAKCPVPAGESVEESVEKSISVDCLVPHEGRYIPAGGGVIVINESAPYAARNCNQVYYACRGKCIGCYIVDEKRICCDIDGNQLENIKE